MGSWLGGSLRSCGRGRSLLLCPHPLQVLTGSQTPTRDKHQWRSQPLGQCHCCHPAAPEQQSRQRRAPEPRCPGPYSQTFRGGLFQAAQPPPTLSGPSEHPPQPRATHRIQALGQGQSLPAPASPAPRSYALPLRPPLC